MDNLDLLNNDLQVTPPVQTYLAETAKWAKFLSILGFIMCALMLIFAFILPAYMMQLPQYNELSSSAISGLKVGMTIIYLACAVLLFFPCLYLNRFSVKMQSSLKATSQDGFEASFMNLKSTFKFYGITAIVVLSIYVLVFIVGIIGVAMR